MYVMSFSSMYNLLDRHNGKYMRKSFPYELCWISKRNFTAVELIWEGNTVCSRSKDDGFLPKKVSKQTKGQLISECLFDNLKFSKKNNEKFDKFLP